ncbi:MAG TPA: hypothetical protein VHW90_03305 [Stellaceae bacterium]|nr:hypothetical protein [Stellaceae bacterium]
MNTVSPGRITIFTKPIKRLEIHRSRANVSGNAWAQSRLWICPRPRSRSSDLPTEYAKTEQTMHYPDGQDVRLGDRVKLGPDESGVVVASIDTSEYSSEYPAAQWDYLKKGVMIEFPRYGLIHYEEPDEDLRLVGRAPALDRHWPRAGE